MRKTHITLSINYDLRQKAEEKKINCSRLLEEALELELNERIYKESQENICVKCNKKVEQGDAHIENMIGDLFYLYHKSCVPEQKTLRREEYEGNNGGKEEKRM
jgi:hypothetical protein